MNEETSFKQRVFAAPILTPINYCCQESENVHGITFPRVFSWAIAGVDMLLQASSGGESTVVTSGNSCSHTPSV